MKRSLSVILSLALLLSLLGALLSGCAGKSAETALEPETAAVGSEAVSAPVEDTVKENPTVRVRVPESWAEPCAWAWSGSRNLYNAWPGEKLLSDGEGYYVEIPSWVDSFIINANGGSVQTKDLSIRSGRDVWITVSESGVAEISYSGFAEIVPGQTVSHGLPAEELAVDTASLRSDYRTDDNNRVFYEIFVGSFSDSNGDGIGDLRGVIDRMDYLNDGDPASGKSLGVEGIWLTPIFRSPSYHKYDVTDYYTIDPSFGTMDDLRELCELCEERNVTLILDMVLNHTGRENAWFKSFTEAHKNGETDSEWYDFYSWAPAGQAPAGRTFRTIPGCTDLYECNFSDDMPELNFESPAVREKVLEVARYYLDLGVDGFRFDAVKYVYYDDHSGNVEFWSWYADELRKLRSDIYMVGEVWDSPNIIDLYYGALNCFDFSTSMREGLIAQAAGGSGVSRLCDYEESFLAEVKPLRGDATIVPFVSNHDMDRTAGFLSTANGRMQMAANLYLLGPGSPFIYYGEELGMTGSRGGSMTDANRRLAMLWGDDDTVSDPVGADYPARNRLSSTAADQLPDAASLYTYYKTLLLIRQANPEIARGDYTALSGGSNSLGGFVSVWNGKAVCVVHNASTSEKTVDLADMTELSFTRLAASIGQGDASLSGGKLTLGPQTSAVLRAD